MLDAVGQSSQTAPTDSSQSNPSRKRSREFFDALSQLIIKNVNKKPVLLPKRQPTESDLLAKYHANRVSQQQPAQRSPAAFQYSPARKPAPAPSIFTPATSKMYASPRSGSAGPGGSPIIPLAPVPTQQHGFFGQGLAQSAATTPAHNRWLLSPAEIHTTGRLHGFLELNSAEPYVAADAECIFAHSEWFSLHHLSLLYGAHPASSH